MLFASRNVLRRSVRIALVNDSRANVTRSWVCLQSRFYRERYVRPDEAVDADDVGLNKVKKMQNDPALIEQEAKGIKTEVSGVEENEQVEGSGTLIVEEDEMEIGDKFFGPDKDESVKPQVALVWLTGALGVMGGFFSLCYYRAQQLEPALGPRKMANSN